MNKQVTKLVKNWKNNGSPQQEAFNWASNKVNWIKSFQRDSDFIAELPEDIDREVVRGICCSSRFGIREKFLSVMVWGYGDRGYGPFRVTQMMNQGHTENVLTEVYKLSQYGEVKSAYEYLSTNRIRGLGPSYGSKFMSFCAPRTVGAPIYDSLIARWVGVFAEKDFVGVAVSSETWNLKTYSRYWDWVKMHSEELECYPDEVELVLFRDAESKFSKASNWNRK